MITNGEWSTDKSGQIMTDADELIIADVHGWTDEEIEANSKLIVQSKKMYKILKEYLEYGNLHSDRCKK